MFLAALVLAAPAAAASPPVDAATKAPIDPALAGRQHGDGARGDGPLAELLRIVTPEAERRISEIVAYLESIQESD